MPKQRITQKNSGLDHKEWQLLKSLNTPKKIQDFLNSLPFNHEKHGETHYSVKCTLRNRTANCFEGALVAAGALWIQGQKPLLLDLKAALPDFDHVVALFRIDKHWGSISKTNHAVLRYREPVYKTLRELVMSYFHEYFLNNGKKTLISYSRPYSLSVEGKKWLVSLDSLADIAYRLDKFPHTKILTPKQIKNLRKADEIEIKAGKLKEYP